MSPPPPLVSVEARPLGPKCPFGSAVQFDLQPGGCVWLQGPSGRGKTTLAMYLAGLLQSKTLQKLQMDISVEWDPSIALSERAGVLFQQTTLLDELTVAGNLAVGLHQHDRFVTTTPQQRDLRIKQLLDTVGLAPGDAAKRPTELSGGMGRRACLALQLSQRKHVIVLDEPFTGLDHEAALSVAKELVHLRKLGAALVLISHQEDLAHVVLAKDTCSSYGNVVVELSPPKRHCDQESAHANRKANLLFGTCFRDRFVEKLVDYVFWSLPLILLTFIACGMAIAMLSSDTLRRIDVTDRVLSIVDDEVRPLIKMLTGEEATTMHMLGVKLKVRQMLHATVPPAKATLYAVGMSKLFVLEIGPLLTALLLTGRIGGSYAGKVATMQATSQNKLLRTLGIHPQTWSLWPSLAAALLAGPVLTVVGTFVALYLGAQVGPAYGIGTPADYWAEVRSVILPDLRLRGLLQQPGAAATPTKLLEALWYHRDYRTTFSDDLRDTWIEILTYPVIYHLVKALAFMTITMGVAETCARLQPNLTPRGVPSVITSSVVLAGFLVILADWGFSQLLLQRY